MRVASPTHSSVPLRPSEQVVANDSPHAERRPTKCGFLNPQLIRGLAFWITSLCLLVVVVACLLAIWGFTDTDILWRTVATCAVIGGDTITFSWWCSRLVDLTS